MILIDSSAWIEYLRDTGSPTSQRVDELLSGEIATCDPIRMEILAGARSESHLADLRGLLARTVELPVNSRHYEEAAIMFRSARSQGLTVRKLIDCLIAVVAIDYNVPLLQADKDFDSLRQVSSLRLELA